MAVAYLAMNTSPAISAAASSCIAGMACEQVSSVIETVAWPSAARERPSNEPRSSTGGRTDTGLDWRSSGIEGKCDRSGRSSVTTSTRTLASTLRGVVSVDHFALDDQIASQAGAVRDVLDSLDVPQLDPGRPLVFTGIGTSLHACKIACYWAAELSAGRIRPTAVEAHEYALRGTIGAADQIVVVSHRGTKRFPVQVLDRAQVAGAATIAVTGRGAAHPGGDIVVRTCADERARTHTVSYTTALAVLARLVAGLVGSPAAARFEAAVSKVPSAMAETLAQPTPVAVLPLLTNKEPILLTGFGIDAVTMSEAALKIKEGAYLWAEAMSIELALHGTPAVFEPRHAAIVAVPDEDDGGRTAAFLGMLQELHIRAILLGTGDHDLPFAKVEYLLRPFVSIIPLQRLVAELARRRGTNPDTTRTDVEPYKSAIGRVRL